MNKVLTIKCFESCVYEVNYPLFFVSAPLPKVKKLFKFMFQFGYLNEAAIADLDRMLPTLAEEWKPIYEAAEKSYTEGLQDTKLSSLPKDWTKEHKYLEQQRRREHNSELLSNLREAQAQYEHAQKLNELYEMSKAPYRI